MQIYNEWMIFFWINRSWEYRKRNIHSSKHDKILWEKHVSDNSKNLTIQKQGMNWPSGHSPNTKRFLHVAFMYWYFSPIEEIPQGASHWWSFSLATALVVIDWTYLLQGDSTEPFWRHPLTKYGVFFLYNLFIDAEANICGSFCPLLPKKLYGS